MLLSTTTSVDRWFPTTRWNVVGVG